MTTRRLSMSPGDAFRSEGPEGRRRSAMREENRLLAYFDAEQRRFVSMTASQFTDIWRHFDRDGNGFIDGDELETFLFKLVECLFPTSDKQQLSDEEGEELVSELMHLLDTNKDNRIDLKELAQLLPTDEEFILIFQHENTLNSSVEFMKVWKAFDKDHSGFIEADELKEFLMQLLGKGPQLNEEQNAKIIEYTDSILKVFDHNGDGKLQLSEMARLLPVEENFLCRPMFRRSGQITPSDIERVFEHYDTDKNGTIEDTEFSGFIKDLLELVYQVSITHWGEDVHKIRIIYKPSNTKFVEFFSKDFNKEDIDFTRKTILSKWDVNHDGKINLEEMRMLLHAYCSTPTNHTKESSTNSSGRRSTKLSSGLRSLFTTPSSLGSSSGHHM